MYATVSIAVLVAAFAVLVGLIALVVARLWRITG